jgi:hypothetical protein
LREKEFSLTLLAFSFVEILLGPRFRGDDKEVMMLTTPPQKWPELVEKR